MRIITHFFSVFLLCGAVFFLHACGYKSDPFWNEAEKQDLLLP